MFQIMTVCALLAAPPANRAASHAKYPGRTDFDVERIARSYRIQIYNVFRSERDEYNRRRASADEILDAWTAAGHDPDHRSLVIAWFRQAIVASEAGEDNASLPALPQFAFTDFIPQSSNAAESVDTVLIDRGKNLSFFPGDGPAVDPNPSEGLGSPVLRSIGRAVIKAVAPAASASQAAVVEDLAEGEDAEITDESWADEILGDEIDGIVKPVEIPSDPSAHEQPELSKPL